MRRGEGPNRRVGPGQGHPRRDPQWPLVRGMGAPQPQQGNEGPGACKAPGPPVLHSRGEGPVDGAGETPQVPAPKEGGSHPRVGEGECSGLHTDTPVREPQRSTARTRDGDSVWAEVGGGASAWVRRDWEPDGQWYGAGGECSGITDIRGSALP